MMRTVLLFLIPIAVAGVLYRWYRRVVRGEQATLDKYVWDVIARLSHGRELLLKEILKCDFVETLDGREQRFVTLENEDFRLVFSKETRRDRYWARLARGHDIFENSCRGSVKLGKSIAALFSSVDRYSGKTVETPEAATETQPVSESAGAS